MRGCIRRAAAALLFVLSVLLLAPARGAAQPEVTRYPLDDPAAVKSGSFFQEYSGLVVPNPSFEAEEARVIGGPERVAEMAAGAGAMETDLLGRELMRGLDAVRSAALNIRVLRTIFREDDVFSAQLSAARHLVHLPDGTQRALPVVVAWRLQRGVARAAARALANRPAPASLGGSYAAATEGSQCPLTGGPVELVQQGRAVELIREGRLLFGGVVGQSELVLLANEQRYGTVTRGGDGTRIEAPDRPSELYVGPLGPAPLVLGGERFKTCTVTLTRAR